MEDVLNTILLELNQIKSGQIRIENRINDLNTRFETEVSSLNVGQVRLEAEVVKLNEGQNRLETEVSSLNEGQVRLEAEMAKLNEGQVRLEHKIDGIERKITAIPKSYENLEEFVARQQRVIEELSARSIELGADIKEIHRIIKEQ